VHLDGHQDLRVVLPFAVDGSRSQATVVHDGAGGRNLKVRMPYRPYADVVERARKMKAAAAVLDQLDLGDDDDDDILEDIE